MKAIKKSLGISSSDQDDENDVVKAVCSSIPPLSLLWPAPHLSCRETRALTRAVLAPRSRLVRSNRALFVSWYARALALSAHGRARRTLCKGSSCAIVYHTCCYIARGPGMQHLRSTQSTCPAGCGLGYTRLIPAVTCGAPLVLLQERIEQGGAIENVTEFCRHISKHRGHGDLQHRGCRCVYTRGGVGGHAASRSCLRANITHRMPRTPSCCCASGHASVGRYEAQAVVFLPAPASVPSRLATRLQPACP